MNGNRTDRLAAMEAARNAVQSAVQAVSTAVGELGATLRRQAETTAQGFEALTEMIRVVDVRLSELDSRMSVLTAALDTRMSVLQARMADIAQELRTHSHKAA